MTALAFSPFSTLSDEAKLAIFQNLPIRDVANVRATCKDFWRLAGDDFFLKKHLPEHFKEFASCPDVALVWQARSEEHRVHRNMGAGEFDSYTIRGQKERGCALLQNGNVVSLSSCGHVVRIWNLEQGKPVAGLNFDDSLKGWGWITCCAALPRQTAGSPGQMIALAYVYANEGPDLILGPQSARIGLWDPEQRPQSATGYAPWSSVLELNVKTGCKISALAPLPGGVAFCSDVGGLQVLHFETEVVHEVCPFPGLGGRIVFDVRRDGALVFHSLGTREIRSWDNQHGVQILVSEIPDLDSICCLQDGKVAMVESCSRNFLGGFLKVWDPALGSRPVRLGCCSDNVRPAVGGLYSFGRPCCVNRI